MADYYMFLWRATWIKVVGFLVLCLFVLVRMLWKTWSAHKRGLGRWGELGVLLKGMGWLGILSAYLLMLYKVEPDWFAGPRWIEGEIQEKTMIENSKYPYSIDIKTDSKSYTLLVDQLSYRELIPGQKAKISYLPYRLEVITCEILPE